MGSEDSNRPQSWDPLRQGLVWPGPCLLTDLPRTAHHLGVCSHWMLGLPGLPSGANGGRSSLGVRTSQIPVLWPQVGPLARSPQPEPSRPLCPPHMSWATCARQGALRSGTFQNTDGIPPHDALVLADPVSPYDHPGGGGMATSYGRGNGGQEGRQPVCLESPLSRLTRMQAQSWNRLRLPCSGHLRMELLLSSLGTTCRDCGCPQPKWAACRCEGNVFRCPECRLTCRDGCRQAWGTSRGERVCSGRCLRAPGPLLCFRSRSGTWGSSLVR